MIHWYSNCVYLNTFLKENPQSKEKWLDMIEKDQRFQLQDVKKIICITLSLLKICLNCAWIYPSYLIFQNKVIFNFITKFIEFTSKTILT